MCTCIFLIHLNRILHCLPHLPAYFYWYGQKCKSPEQPPKWVEKLLNEAPPSTETTERPLDHGVDIGHSRDTNVVSDGTGRGIAATCTCATAQASVLPSGVKEHETDRNSGTLSKSGTLIDNQHSSISSAENVSYSTEQDAESPSAEIRVHSGEVKHCRATSYPVSECEVSSTTATNAESSAADTMRERRVCRRKPNECTRNYPLQSRQARQSELETRSHPRGGVM